MSQKKPGENSNNSDQSHSNEAQEKRIERLKAEAEKLAGGKMVTGQAPGAPRLDLDLEEQFWKNVVAIESAPQITFREILARDGMLIQAPAALDDDQLQLELWVLIHRLAKRRIFLESTNHLSDRDLYTLLVDRILEEKTESFPEGSSWNQHIVIQEYGDLQGADGQEVFLRYYADEFDREEWAPDLPGKLPPHEEFPCDRDRHLPRPQDLE